MNTIYVNKIKITNSLGIEFYGVEFIDDNGNSSVYTDFRVFNKEKLNDFKIELLESTKVPLYDINLFKNGKNGIIGKVDIKLKKYSGDSFGGNFDNTTSISEMIAISFSRIVSNDYKVYKLNDFKIPF